MIQRNALLSKMCHLEKKPQKLLKKKKEKKICSVVPFVPLYLYALIRHTRGAR